MMSRKRSERNEFHLMLLFFQERQSGHEYYENVSGMCEPKRQFPNINWDSDSSESEEEEEELNYTKVSFTATSQHNPQKAIISDEDKTEYSEVKI